MAMLSGPDIQAMVDTGRIYRDGRLTDPGPDRVIRITPFDRDRVGANSVDLTLDPCLLVYKPRRWWNFRRGPLIWGRSNPPDAAVEIPAEGYVIRPGWFYLGSTVEHTETRGFVPRIDGRSSTGRLSLHVHATAGFGDDGFRGRWTLEMYSIVPVVIFAGAAICQISYHTLEGPGKPYAGRYQDSFAAVPSQSHQDHPSHRKPPYEDHPSVHHVVDQV